MLRENLERNFGFILHDVARLLRTSTCEVATLRTAAAVSCSGDC